MQPDTLAAAQTIDFSLLALFLRASEKIDLQVNIETLTDAEYFSDAHNNNNISTGAPINARFTARARF